jgi:hypothetical protein
VFTFVAAETPSNLVAVTALSAAVFFSLAARIGRFWWHRPDYFCGPAALRQSGGVPQLSIAAPILSRSACCYVAARCSARMSTARSGRPAENVSGARSARQRSHSRPPAKRTVKKSTKLRTFAESCRPRGYTTLRSVSVGVYSGNSSTRRPAAISSPTMKVGSNSMPSPLSAAECKICGLLTLSRPLTLTDCAIPSGPAQPPGGQTRSRTSGTRQGRVTRAASALHEPCPVGKIPAGAFSSRPWRLEPERRPRRRVAALSGSVAFEGYRIPTVKPRRWHCQLKQRWYAPAVGGAVVGCGEVLGTPTGLSPSQPRGDRKLTSTPLS